MVRLLAVAAVLVQVLVMAAGAAADEFKLTPSVALRQEYNDNIFFDVKDEEDDFITRIRTGLDLLNRTERLDLRLAGFLTPFIYWDHDEISSIDQEYTGRVSYRLTPLLSAGADASVRVDHQPDRDIDTTGLAYADNRRLQQRYGANIGYQFTERTAASLAYGYQREDWHNVKDDDIEDYDSHSITAGLSRELGAARGVTVGLLNFGWAHYEYESSTTDYYFGTVGARHRLTEIFTLAGDVGARYTDSEFDVQQLAIVPPGVPRVVTREKQDSGLGGSGTFRSNTPANARGRASVAPTTSTPPAAAPGLSSGPGSPSAAATC